MFLSDIPPSKKGLLGCRQYKKNFAPLQNIYLLGGLRCEEYNPIPHGPRGASWPLMIGRMTVAVKCNPQES
jgi:hypothetical protein